MPSLQLNGLFFEDGFVGLSDLKQDLQDMVNVVHAYSKKWHFCKNVFEKEWNKYKIPCIKRKKYVLDVVSDMDLNSTSLGSKEAVSI